ncbi:DUF3159 domain-containing protein [Nocardia sp. NBC_01327]|uniref:DUF3159 domain-containing protein n=1 Tax=Nocardia sp. NBC_01327 TaxID=2903593 RepID=UPI002E10FC1C|nr:DUF3159 domain-containing protein [Nocardia sp. NBC_01327]
MEPAQEVTRQQPLARPLRQFDRRHVIDALVPNSAFLLGYVIAGPLAGVAGALVVASVLVLVRVLRSEPLRLIAMSFGAVLLQAALVVGTGEGRNFFLSWLVVNTALLVVFAGSLVRGRPITVRIARRAGLPEDSDLHQRLTGYWLGLWALHLAVGLPLYLVNQVVALGIAHFVLGLPLLFALAVLSWRLLTRPAAPAPALYYREEVR